MGKARQPGASTPAPVLTPDWPSVARPPFSPPPTASRLHAGLLVLDSFFLSQTLQAWNSFLSFPNSPIALLPSPPAKRGEASRTNSRYGVQDPAFAERLWIDSGLKELCLAEEEMNSPNVKLRPIGLNPNIRLYSYAPSAYFGPHYDDDFWDLKLGWRSEWTLLIYLSGEEDGVQGGATVFYPDGKLKSPLVVSLKRGRAVLLRHGQNCMLHEGQKVDKGVKWVLRSDVMYG